MAELITTANIESPDDFYQLLTDMSIGLSAEQIALVNARLILLLCNHIGDNQVLAEAVATAAKTAAK
ncbi:MAG: hypothetical protein OFPII_28700 [Osedax symbiont Rs1]|nr:MAG: hypothetical protein OFPII_28700 [Osedax symbiont Rs1]